jgi:hypothetical protein
MSAKPKRTQPKKAQAQKKPSKEAITATNKIMADLVSNVMSGLKEKKVGNKGKYYAEFKEWEKNAPKTKLNQKTGKMTRGNTYFNFMADQHQDELKLMQQSALSKTQTPEARAKAKATREKKALKNKPCMTGCTEAKAEALKTVMAMFGTCKKQCKTKKQTGAEATMTLLKNMGIA